MGTALDLRAGTPVYSRALDDVRVEVYFNHHGYSVFIVGEAVASFLGTAASLDECMEEIDGLERLVNSKIYQREIARHI